MWDRERDGGVTPGLLVELNESNNSRVGCCWMAGRLKDGDLAMAMQQAGDCFWNYCLVERCGIRGGNGPDGGRRLYRLILGSEFGAYVTGVPYKYQPTAREMHLLMAGEMTPLDAEPRNQ